MNIRKELNHWLEIYNPHPGEALPKAPDVTIVVGEDANHPHGLYDQGYYLGSVRCASCHSRPSIEFEQATGIRNVAGQYRMPEDLAPHEVENYNSILWISEKAKKIAPETRLQTMVSLWENLVSLNPDLDTVKPDPSDYWHVVGAICGVTSGFNACDIHAFIRFKTSYRSEDYKKKLNSVEAELGDVIMEWAPCTQTLDYIQQQIKQRQPKL